VREIPLSPGSRHDGNHENRHEQKPKQMMMVHR